MRVSRRLVAGLRRAAAACILLLLASLSSAFEKYECTEYWYNQGISASQDRQADRVADCTKTGLVGRWVGKYYLVVGGKAFWTFFKKERHSPCSGKGVGALGNLFDPVCYLPSRLQTHHTMERRSYWLVSEDGDNFRLVGSDRKDLAAWQRESLNRYARDRTAVYLNTDKLPEADPQTFEVLFPYGDDVGWDRYYFARDRRHTYIDEYLVPAIDLDRVAWITLPCVEQAISCRDSAYGAARIGTVGRDILFLRYGYRPTVIRNRAKPGLLCFRSAFTTYCRIDGKVYAIKPDFNEDARLVLEDQQAFVDAGLPQGSTSNRPDLSASP